MSEHRTAVTATDREIKRSPTVVVGVKAEGGVAASALLQAQAEAASATTPRPAPPAVAPTPGPAAAAVPAQD